MFAVIIKNVIKAAANRAHINHSFTDSCNSKVATQLLLLERYFYPCRDKIEAIAVGGSQGRDCLCVTQGVVNPLTLPGFGIKQ